MALFSRLPALEGNLAELEGGGSVGSPALAMPQESQVTYWPILIYWLGMPALEDLTQLHILCFPKAGTTWQLKSHLDGTLYQ